MRGEEVNRAQVQLFLMPERDIFGYFRDPLTFSHLFSSPSFFTSERRARTGYHAHATTYRLATPRSCP